MINKELTDEEIEEYESLVRKLINNVDMAIRPQIGTKEAGITVKIGADGTPTKQIDIIAEKAVIDTLSEYGKVCFLISEEIGELRIEGDDITPCVVASISDKEDRRAPIFVIDPLDGTGNAIKNISIYGISVAVALFPETGPARLSDVILGMIKNFTDNAIYHAIRGRGAFRRNIPIKPSSEMDLSKATVGGFVYGGDFIPYLKLLKSIRRLRVMGSVAIELCYVSSGNYEVFMDLRRSRVIDVSAAKLIVEEAGGIFENFEEEVPDNILSIDNKTSVIASANANLQRKVVGIYKNRIDFEKPLRKIGVTSRIDNKHSIQTIDSIIQRLITKVELKVDSSVSEVLGKYKEISMPLEDMECDAILALGGDGTIIRTKDMLYEKSTPILGVNHGTIGFLTELEPSELDAALDNLIEGNYHIEKRTQLTVKNKDNIPPALNEIVITTGTPAKMIDMEIYINDNLAESIRADGLIVSTPSGSTAYSMSAGGPITDPEVSALIIIPICPYKLGARAMVVPDDAEIKIRLTKKDKKAIILIDGQNRDIEVEQEEVIISKYKNDAQLISLNNDFYTKLRNKL